MSHPQTLTSLSAFVPTAPRRQATTPGPTVVQIAGADSYTEINIRLRRAFLKLRGADPTWSESRVPAATNADVLTIARAWNRAIESADAFKSDTQDIPKLQRWIDYQERLADMIEERRGDDVYADNGQLWDREFDRIAIWLDSRKSRPETWGLVVAAVEKALDDLPDRLERFASGAGEVAVAPIAGAANALGITKANFLLGAGVLAGIIFIAARKR